MFVDIETSTTVVFTDEMNNATCLAKRINCSGGTTIEQSLGYACAVNNGVKDTRVAWKFEGKSEPSSMSVGHLGERFPRTRVK